MGIAYPDGRLFVIRDLVNDLTHINALIEAGLRKLEPFNPAFLPHWTGIGNVIIEQSVSSQLPRGEYVLYLLSMPATAPIDQIDQGELNMTTFRIE